MKLAGSYPGQVRPVFGSCVPRLSNSLGIRPTTLPSYPFSCRTSGKAASSGDSSFLPAPLVCERPLVNHRKTPGPRQRRCLRRHISRHSTALISLLTVENTTNSSRLAMGHSGPNVIFPSRWGSRLLYRVRAATSKRLAIQADSVSGATIHT